jgi:hypothetical protein
MSGSLWKTDLRHEVPFKRTYIYIGRENSSLLGRCGTGNKYTIASLDARVLHIQAYRLKYFFGLTKQLKLNGQTS